MDVGTLLASKFAARDTEQKSAKQEQEERIRSQREMKEKNFIAVKALFVPIVDSFNAAVGSGPRISIEIKGNELRFDHGFTTVLLLKVGEAHVEISRGGAHGRFTKPFPKPFFFVGYGPNDEALFSESYHIESAWMTGEEFAIYCLHEALNID